jgi:uroporphyrinogen-III synthase
MKGREVWITRARPGAEASAAWVRLLGHEAVVAPLLSVRDIPGEIDLAGVDALAFTSANGARAFAARSAARDLPVYAVGEATAAAAREAGFADVRTAEGDVAALARLIIEERPGSVLHAGARVPAGDLVGALNAAGIEARRLALYESVPTGLSAAPRAAYVLAHSPAAARELAAMLYARPAPHLTVLCLSPAVAAPLQDLPLARLAVAAAPTEAALKDLLAAHAGAPALDAAAPAPPRGRPLLSPAFWAMMALAALSLLAAAAVTIAPRLARHPFNSPANTTRHPGGPP